MSTKPTFAAFNQGVIPTIACFNKATVALGVDLDALIAAMQDYIVKSIVPVWGTPANLVKTTDFQPGAWAIVFLDNADQPGALASHELVEMLVDPATNMMTTGPDPTLIYAYESADPVEALSFKVDGIPMSDFVYPAYFETFRQPGSVQFDYMSKVTQPFQILADGYQIIFQNGKWTQVFGSAEKAKAFAKEDRRGHRSEQREMASKQLQPADLGERRQLLEGGHRKAS